VSIEIRGFILFSGLEEFDFVRTDAAAEQFGHAKDTNNELSIIVSCLRVTGFPRRNNPSSSITTDAFEDSQTLISATINVLLRGGVAVLIKTAKWFSIGESFRRAERTGDQCLLSRREAIANTLSATRCGITSRASGSIGCRCPMERRS
jgi:hypothetical protein